MLFRSLLARHALHSGRCQTIAVAAHHAGIPLGHVRMGKAKLELTVSAPQVEVRPLEVYEAMAEMEAVA